MTTTDLRTLFSYNAWANERVFGAVARLSADAYARDLGSSHGGVHGTLVHLLGAQDIWLERWNGRSPERFYQAGDFSSFAEVASRRAESDAAMSAFADAVDETRAATVIHYRDLRGNAHAAPLWQLMQHVVNHSTYHRGQIVTMLRQLGAEAVSTDLVAYYRQFPTH